MALNCGIVGLPNVGKSTIFSALTSAPAEAANYPFCTIDPNFGIVSVPDKRLSQIAQLIPPEKIIPAVVEFVDIAGLVKGASHGEGLGNQFLSHIRGVGVIVHVVRCFDNPDIVHVTGKVDPVSDIEIVSVELALADLETVEKRIVRSEKLTRSQDKDVVKNAKATIPLLEQLRAALGDGKPARSVELSEEQRALLSDLQLMTMKDQIYVCNVDEEGLRSVIDGREPEAVSKVREVAKQGGAEVLVVCGQLEKEIAALETEEDRAQFLSESGLAESGLDRLVHSGYRMLGLRTFFTAGPKEVRAWTIHEGDLAPQAAGVIHTDFEKGFIKAEVYHCEDLFSLGSEQKVKEAGRLRIEGKEYVVKDGDIMHFRFNV